MSKKVKVFELAKEKGYTDNKELLDILKEMGVAVKTPISSIPNEDLERVRKTVSAKVPEPFTPVEEDEPVAAAAARRATADRPNVKDQITPEKLKVRPFQTVEFEGLDKKFSQCLLGIKREVIDGKKVSSLLTVAFNPDTLEMKVVSEEPKRTDAEAILEFRMAVRKLKVEQ